MGEAEGCYYLEDAGCTDQTFLTIEREVEAELSTRGIYMMDVVKKTASFFNKMKNRPIRGEKKVHALIYCFYLALIDGYPDRVSLVCRFFNISKEELAKITRKQDLNAEFDIAPVKEDPIPLVKDYWTRYYGTPDGYENVENLLKRILSAKNIQITKRGRSETYQTSIDAISPIELVISTMFYYFESLGFTCDKAQYLQKNGSTLTPDALTNICKQLRNIDALVPIV